MAAQGYIGRAPGDSSVIVARQTFTPTGITTNFTFASGYTVGYVDAYLNGARLIEGDDYTATDGSVVGLTTHAINGDVLELVAYKAFNIGDVTGALNDFSVSNDLTVGGAATVTGAITATGGVVGNVTGDATGLSGTPDLTIRNLIGVAATFTGVLSYDDVTNVDAVGYSTFREGINVQGAGSTTTTLNVSGVTTMTGDANFGSVLNIDDSIVHSGDSNTKIRFPAADTFAVETGGIQRVLLNSNLEITAGIATIIGRAKISSDEAITLDNNSHTGETLFLRSGGTAGAGNTQALLAFGKADSSSQRTGSALGSIQTESDADRIGLAFYTSPGSTSSQTLQEKLRITHDGRVGIGDNEPDVQLNVKGSGTSFAGQNTHVKIEDTTSLAANVGGLLAFEGVYTSGGDPAAFAMIHAGKDNADTGNYAGYLRFFTRSNGSLPAERLRITSGGNVGINSTNPGYLLDIASGNASMRLNSTSTSTLVMTSGASNSARIEFGDLANNDTGYIYYDNSDDSMQFATNGSEERLRIDSSGRFLLGLNSARTVGGYGIPGIQNDSTNTSQASMALIHRQNGTNINALVFARARDGGANGGRVQQHDDYGAISFQGFGGTGDANYRQSAEIRAACDGTPGANDMPGRLEFLTTPDGSTTPAERMRIQSDGKTLINWSSTTGRFGRLTIFDGDDFSTASQPGINDNIYLSSDATSGNGVYGASIAFSRVQYQDRRAAAIVAKQTTADEDQVGLAFFTHSSTDAAAAMVESLTLTHDGNLTATGNVTAYSDITLKENIETIPNALNKVLNLRGVEFDRVDKPENPHEIGVIAQEVEEIIPEVVHTNHEGIKSVAYGNLVGLLIESIKELKAEVNDLKAQLEG